MKQQNSQVSLVPLSFLLLFYSFSLTSARLLVPRKGEKGVEASEMAHVWSSKDLKGDPETLGSDECDEKDVECSSRRMIAEAHLDDIYTQNLKR